MKTDATEPVGVIHAIGMVNFLFDKSQAPHIQSADIVGWFRLSSSTISAKSKVIRDMLNIYQCDLTWTLPSKIDDNPIVWMVDKWLHRGYQASSLRTTARSFRSWCNPIYPY